MPEITPQERLQPALLDRLRDDDPANTRESLEERVISMQELYDSVVRDLEWLFNCENLASVVDLKSHPEIARSVVNYGIDGLSGRTIARHDMPILQGMIREAVLTFEPRVLPESLEVRVAANLEALDRSRLVFEVRGELWAIPQPLEFFMATEVDMETGAASVVKHGRTLPEAGSGFRSSR